jgi:hypothetical protein
MNPQPQYAVSWLEVTPITDGIHVIQFKIK